MSDIYYHILLLYNFDVIEFSGICLKATFPFLQFFHFYNHLRYNRAPLESIITEALLISWYRTTTECTHMWTLTCGRMFRWEIRLHKKVLVSVNENGGTDASVSILLIEARASATWQLHQSTVAKICDLNPLNFYNFRNCKGWVEILNNWFKSKNCFPLTVNLIVVYITIEIGIRKIKINNIVVVQWNKDCSVYYMICIRFRHIKILTWTNAGSRAPLFLICLQSSIHLQRCFSIFFLFLRIIKLK